MIYCLMINYYHYYYYIHAGGPRGTLPQAFLSLADGLSSWQA